MTQPAPPSTLMKVHLREGEKVSFDLIAHDKRGRMSAEKLEIVT
jgi:hypothetical protein